MATDGDTQKILLANLATVAFFLAKEIYSGIKGNSKHHDKIIEKNVDAINGLTLALTELRVRFDHLTQLVSSLPRIKADVDQAHQKIREMEIRTGRQK